VSDPVAYSGTFPTTAGRFTVTMTVLGEARSVVVYVPRTRATNPPLVLMFHGTNGDGDVILDDSGARAMADAAGVVVAAPSSRWFGHGDFDHTDADTYWETAPNLDLERNQDLVLVRAILVEARRALRVDPARVYALGHSNGGFFALTVGALLRDRVAAVATSSAGLVRCARTTSCTFTGSGATCAALRGTRGWCTCEGPELPVTIPTGTPRLAVYLAHGTDDPMVSVQYSCAMEERLTAQGHAATVVLRPGDGHTLPASFAQDAWAFFASRRR
jgi:poly(3-hydroxybutyrate) depolymerase